MIVPPPLAINNVRDPFWVNKMSVSDFSTDLKPVEFQINVKCRKEQSHYRNSDLLAFIWWQSQQTQKNVTLYKVVKIEQSIIDMTI